MPEPSVVLVTGAGGFLGSHLVRRLVRDGHSVHVLVRASSSVARLSDVAQQWTRWNGELGDMEATAKACRGSQAEVIIHCAGETAARHAGADREALEPALRVNLHGTLALLHGAARAGTKVTRVVRIGGLEEYGTAPTPWTEDTPEQPSSPYSESQVATTHACLELQPRLPFDVVTLRPALVYGPDQSTDFLIPALITSLLRGERFAMTTGQQQRDLLYVDDFVDAAVRACFRPGLRGAILNISTAVETPVVEVAREIARLLAGEALLDIGVREGRPGELQHLVADNAKARQALHWHPTVPLDVGLARTVEWYRMAAASGGLS